MVGNVWKWADASTFLNYFRERDIEAAVPAKAEDLVAGRATSAAEKERHPAASRPIKPDRPRSVLRTVAAVAVGWLPLMLLGFWSGCFDERHQPCAP